MQKVRNGTVAKITSNNIPKTKQKTNPLWGCLVWNFTHFFIYKILNGKSKVQQVLLFQKNKQRGPRISVTLRHFKLCLSGYNYIRNEQHDLHPALHDLRADAFHA